MGLQREARGLVILREEDRCHRAVGFGDEPEPDAARGVVGGDNPGTLGERVIVGFAVCGRDFAPVASLVAPYAEEDVLLCEGLQGVWRGDDAGRAETRLRELFALS